MAFVQLNYLNTRPLAFMAGAEGNVPALQACLRQAKRQSAQIRLFLGNALGAFGHSDEMIYLLETSCTHIIKGQHEIRLLAQNSTPQLPAPGRARRIPSPDSGLQQRLYRAHCSLHPANHHLIRRWCDLIRIQTPNGALLACFESPDYLTPVPINRQQLDTGKMLRWLDCYKAQGLIIGSDHQPWIEPLPGGRFVASCGASGFASHPLYSDVHYLLVEPFRARLVPRIERAAYNAREWAEQLKTEGVNTSVTYPLLKGLPPPDQHYR